MQMRDQNLGELTVRILMKCGGGVFHASRLLTMGCFAGAGGESKDDWT